VNAARGGSTIDREYEILRELAMPLDPDIVLLMYVNNDIYEMKDHSRE
jgi:hypothetical protein